MMWHRVRGRPLTSEPAIRPALRSEPVLPGALLLAGGVAGTVLAHGIATSTGDPQAGRTMAATGLVVLLSLLALGAGGGEVLAAERSSMRHVFVSAALRRTALWLGIVAMLLVGGLVWFGCYSELLVGGRVTALMIAGIGTLGGAIALLVVAGVAKRLARLAARDEQL